MARGLAALILLGVFCMCCCACGGKEKHTSATESMTESETSASPTETSERTESATKPVNRPTADPNTEDPHIFDEIGVLSAEDVGALSSIAGALSAEQQLHAAVVLTEELDDKSPEKFAAEYFNSLYGKGSTGFLVLLNNDTGEDRVFTSGACSLYLAQDEISLAIAQATPMLVEGKYRQAAERLLELGERMPDLIYDRAGILNREQFDGFLATAQDAAAKTKKQYCVLLIQEDDSEETEDFLQKYADAQREALHADGLLVVDVRNERCRVSGFSDADARGSELTGIMQSANRLPVTAAVNAYYDRIKEMQ